MLYENNNTQTDLQHEKKVNKRKKMKTTPHHKQRKPAAKVIHENSKQHRQQCKGTTNVNIKTRCFITEHRYREYRIRPESLTVLSSQYKQKFTVFHYYMFIILMTKRKLKLLLRVHKYKHFYTYLSFLRCAQNLMMAGMKGRNMQQC